MRILFDWNPTKADSNQSKHGVAFDEAMTIFADAHAITIFDENHSDDEERWVTLGRSAGGRLLLVVHTHVDIAVDVTLIRIISARRPTRKEAAQYRNRHDS